MSVETHITPRDETFYEDRARLRNQDEAENSPEDQETLASLRAELGGRALAKQQRHQEVLAQLAREEQDRTADTNWRVPKQ